MDKLEPYRTIIPTLLQDYAQFGNTNDAVEIQVLADIALQRPRHRPNQTSLHRQPPHHGNHPPNARNRRPPNRKVGSTDKSIRRQ